MGRYDCVVLFNEATIEEIEGSQEKTYPSTVLREEVTAIEEVLREGGFNPYVFPVESFSKEFVQTLSKLSPKFVFNLCEQLNGKPELEMCVAGLLDLMAIPYTGSGPLTLGLALSKHQVKPMLRAAGIASARGYVLARGQKPDRRWARFPVIVKPAHEDGSLGINSSSVCYNFAQLEKQAAYIHEIYVQEALIEEYLDGREFNVSVLGDRAPEVLAISEIDFSGMPEDEPKIVSYRGKWDEESPMYRGTVPICPAILSKRFENRIKDIALRSYKCVGCRDYARIDMRTDAEGRLHVLEVNPNPDISPVAGFARAAKVAGYSYSDIILRISQLAIERGATIASTVYAF
jgi:D-alanine-D-alanine ligase